jgi:hypothetical protein
MTKRQLAYSSTVVSPWLAVASVAMGAALGAWTFTVAPGNPIRPLLGLVVAATGVYLTTMRLAIGAERGQRAWMAGGRNAGRAASGLVSPDGRCGHPRQVSNAPGAAPAAAGARPPRPAGHRRRGPAPGAVAMAGGTPARTGTWRRPR